MYRIVEKSEIMDQGGGILELHKDLKMPHTMIMADFGKKQLSDILSGLVF